MEADIAPEGDVPAAQPEQRCKTPPPATSSAAIADALSSQRVFKKSAPNNKLTLYVSSRDLIICGNKIDRLQGVLLVEPEYLQERKVFGQVVLTFRYGREDEEVMGLKFCNEAIMCLAQLYPPHERAPEEPNTPLQDALIKRLGPNAHPFCMEVTPLAPPSVQLVPAKEYNGAPIGTSYDVRAYIGDRADEKLHRRSSVRMGIRVVQHAGPVSCGRDPMGPVAEPPHASVDKPFLLSDGRVELEASLDKAEYKHGEQILVNMAIHNNSNKTVRRLKVFVVQHVDVCMFSNGKFKNVVALVTGRDECPLAPGSSLNRTYSLQPVKGATKNWIALEDSFSKSAACLASSVTCNSSSPEDRNVFAIYVSYYVKVKLMVGIGAITAMGGELSLKLPFSLIHSSSDLDPLTIAMSLNTPPPKRNPSTENVNQTALVHETSNGGEGSTEVTNHEVKVDVTNNSEGKAALNLNTDSENNTNLAAKDEEGTAAVTKTEGKVLTNKKREVREDEDLILKCDSEPS